MPSDGFLIVRAGGKTSEETAGLHLSSVESQNAEVMKLAEILRRKRELDIARGMTRLELEVFFYCSTVSNKIY